LPVKPVDSETEDEEGEEGEEGKKEKKREKGEVGEEEEEEEEEEEGFMCLVVERGKDNMKVQVPIDATVADFKTRLYEIFQVDAGEQNLFFKTAKIPFSSYKADDGSEKLRELLDSVRYIRMSRDKKFVTSGGREGSRGGVKKRKPGVVNFVFEGCEVFTYDDREADLWQDMANEESLIAYFSPDELWFPIKHINTTSEAGVYEVEWNDDDSRETMKALHELARNPSVKGCDAGDSSRGGGAGVSSRGAYKGHDGFFTFAGREDDLRHAIDNKLSLLAYNTDRQKWFPIMGATETTDKDTDERVWTVVWMDKEQKDNLKGSHELARNQSVVR
jgi:hypothetical protein